MMPQTSFIAPGWFQLAVAALNLRIVQMLNWHMPLAAFFGTFWAIRTAIQIFYYSNSHWKGDRGKTVVHTLLLVTYSAISVAYLLAAAKDLNK